MALVLATALLSTAVESQAPGTSGQLPCLTGDNLNSRKMTLPRDLPGDPALLFIAFDQDQQGQIDSWTKGLNDSAAVPWLEVPIIEPSNAFVRAMIAGGMRRDITVTEVRERVVTVYTAPDPVAHAVGCTDYRKRLCVAVAERSGRIRLVLFRSTATPATTIMDRAGPRVGLVAIRGVGDVMALRTGSCLPNP